MDIEREPVDRRLRAAVVAMMRLVDLDPRWVGGHDAPADAKQGLSFWCPCCRVTRLAVFFDVPICANPPVDLKALHRSQSDVGHLEDHHLGSILWHREGETFETITLTPSIDASHFRHWHGSVRNGEIR